MNLMENDINGNKKYQKIKFRFIFEDFLNGWLLVLRPIVSLGTKVWSALRGGLSKGLYPVLTRVSEKTTENSERLSRQERPGFEPV